jgi:hypothetical protein
VPELLELYETIRRTRAHAIQEFSRLAGYDWVDGKPVVDSMSCSSTPNIHTSNGPRSPVTLVQASTNHNFGHDEIDHSRHIMRQWEAGRKGQHYWPFPDVVAPPYRDPVRRQRTIDTQIGDRTVTTITFKTSRTYLETLLPTGAFRFEKADTVCRASISVVQPSKANQGVVSQLALGMHGVQYQGDDGTWVSGTYVPVAFESPLGDEVGDGVQVNNGVPSLRCTISPEFDDQSLRLTASIGDAVFAQVSVSGLASCNASGRSSVVEAGVIGESMHMTFRHVAGNKLSGGQDVVLELSTPCSRSPSSLQASIQTAQHAEFWFSDRELTMDRGSESIVGVPEGLLATIDALQQIPIYEIEGAHVASGTGGLAFRAFERM